MFSMRVTLSFCILHICPILRPMDDSPNHTLCHYVQYVFLLLEYLVCFLEKAIPPIFNAFLVRAKIGVYCLVHFSSRTITPNNLTYIFEWHNTCICNYTNGSKHHINWTFHNSGVSFPLLGTIVETSSSASAAMLLETTSIFLRMNDLMRDISMLLNIFVFV
jgi:hypothetical protein